MAMRARVRSCHAYAARVRNARDFPIVAAETRVTSSRAKPKIAHTRHVLLQHTFNTGGPRVKKMLKAIRLKINRAINRGKFCLVKKSSDKIQRCACSGNISLDERQIFQLFRKRESLGEDSPHFAPGFVDRCHQLTRPLSFDAVVRAKRECTFPSFTVKVFF